MIWDVSKRCVNKKMYQQRCIEEMYRRTIYAIGDKVQAYDGRIGIVIETEHIPNQDEAPPIIQRIVIKFPDHSTMEGMADDFKAIGD